MDLRSRMRALLPGGLSSSRALVRASSDDLPDLPLSSAALVEARAAKGIGEQLAPYLQTQPIYHPATYRNFVRYGYLGNELIYAGINLIVKVFAQAQLQVEDDDEEIIPNHPLRTLITKPTDNTYEHTLWEWTLLDLFLAGNAFWEKVRSATGKVVRLQRLEPDRVGIIPSAERYVDRYVYEVGGIWYPIPEANVLHWKFHNPGLGDPLDHYFGVPPMLAAWKSLQTDNQATDFTKVVLQNYAVPGVVIEAKQKVDDEDAKEIKRRYREAVGGKKRGDVFVSQLGMEVKTVGMTLEQLAFDSIRGISETRLLMVLGGAPLVYLLGTSAGMKRAIYNNYSEAREALADDVVGPLWNRIDDAITAFLLPEFDQIRTHYAHFDTSMVIAFEERRMKRIETASTALTRGLMSRDEARALCRLPPVGRDGRDVLYVPVNVETVEIGADGMVVDSPEPESDEDEPEDPQASNRGQGKSKDKTTPAEDAGEDDEP